MNELKLKKFSWRYLFDKIFKMLGIFAIAISFSMLLLLFSSIITKGYKAFITTEISIILDHNKKLIDEENYNKIIELALSEIGIKNDNIFDFISEDNEFILKNLIIKNPNLLGNKIPFWLTASSKLDILEKYSTNHNKFDENSLLLIKKLKEEKLIRTTFNNKFFVNNDSRSPEIAGMGGSIIGSIFTILACMIFAFPLAVATAIYLEEYAPKNKLTSIIEVNINNLAAVPSIVFGLLGLAIFVGTFGVPRSSSLAGGMSLALMVMPIIIITTRNSLQAIPQSIRHAAMALGASDLQILMHYIVPLAMPGIITGAILAIARAIGETAPLILIGMMAFIVDSPHNIYDAATVMPIQIFLWADSPEIGFVEKTSAAIMVLIIILAIINFISVIIRKKFEVKW
jgi:phosphate transport system permease protein